jgi:hypothetical protein
LNGAFISEEVQSVNAPRLATQEIRLGGDRSWIAPTNLEWQANLGVDDY